MSRLRLSIYSFCYTELSVFGDVCVGVPSKHGNIVLNWRQRELFGLKTEGVAGG